MYYTKCMKIPFIKASNLEKEEEQPFQFDTILPANNICNLQKERKELLKAIEHKKKLVVYGPRNCGKTSLIQSEIVPEFRKKNKKAFILNVDLMEVKSLEAISNRIHKAFERAFSETFPTESLFDATKEFLLGLRPTIEFDPLTNVPSISFSPINKSVTTDFEKLFEIIRKSISPKIPTLIIIDEFQDIAFVEGAQGLIRNALQYFNQIPIILLGSKKHILTQIFSVPNAPLAGFGEDLEFGTISHQEYTDYIQTRFDRKKIKISFEDSQKLQDVLYRSPESINIVCNEIYNSFSDKEITWEDIANSVIKIVDKRKSRYEEYLANFTEKEELLLVALQKAQPVKQPTSMAFLNTVNISNRSVSEILKYMYNHSIVDKTAEGYRITDPLLGVYLGRYR